jgi:topoisomerase-4 subunit A
MTDSSYLPSDPDHSISLETYAESAYLAYAMSVVKGRALPDVTDGQKPVQRRILYAMKEMGLTHPAKPVKSARVVGEILGKYHPHGDSSAYEALVRMAQDFTLRYPLIDGQGNFGSRDGDNAAAMRYTEARLTALAELLLSELPMGTVDFMPNYDGAFEEPSLLPARLPMLLLNGASGIAVGMATDIPPHHLNEVAQAAMAVLDHPNITIDELMSHMPGPDFPGGGQIISSTDDIRHLYETGKGSLRVRAQYSIETMAKNHWRVVFHRLPPNTSTQQILAEIEELSNPKIKAGKKALSTEQQNNKTLFLAALDKVRDESDHQSPIRLVFEPKSNKQIPNDFVNLLLAQTSLEKNVSCNFVMVGLDGRPTQKNLKTILNEWVQFRLHTLRRRTAHRLRQVMDRIHILEGRHIVFLHIDAVIQVIRSSDEPQADLMSHFHLSERQAQDILEIRLRQLARLEGIKLEKELAALQEEQITLEQRLNNESVLKKLMKQEMKTDVKQLGDERRTLIEASIRASLDHEVVDEPMTLIVSEKGWIRARSGHQLDVSTLTFKDGDRCLHIIETRSIWPTIVLDDLGRSYTLAIADIPQGRGDGLPLSALIDWQDGGVFQQMISAAPGTQLCCAMNSGYGFLSVIDDLLSRLKTGKAFVKLEAGERLLPVQLFNGLAVHYVLMLAATHGKVLGFHLTELRYLTKGRGLQLMSLPQHETISAIRLLPILNSKTMEDHLVAKVLPDFPVVQAQATTLRGKVIQTPIDPLDFFDKRAKKGKVSQINGVITDFILP